ncbi:MAG: glycosyltransferase family 2 protein [Patescibacteria group bacterium]|jgi:glycosyltransferase involved in cell wall biosynthesis
MPIKYSVIVPVYNEAGSLKELHERLVKVLAGLDQPFELIFVNDGSTDNTAESLITLKPLTVITFRTNFGQTAALDAGIKQAQGDIIITLDGDLQNPPEEIPKLLAKLDQDNLDVVSGWRKNRQDPTSKHFTSRVANVLRKIFVQDGIHDSGCTLKVYRRYCFNELDLFGEIHRFIPGILKWQGFKIGEVVVEHAPRKTGVSKYNSGRMLKGLVDMLGLWFWRRYSSRPLHLFGGTGIICATLGSVLLIGLAIARIFYGYALSTSIWPLVAALFIIVGIQLFIFGLLAEIMIKNYYQNGRKAYTVKSIIQQ